MKLYLQVPKVEHPVTREFESPLLSELAYATAFVSLIILTVINVAVVGYDPAINLNSDFNATQTFWYNAFVRPPKPGTLCDPHIFNVGDSLVTNSSIFEWKTLAITRPNVGKSGLAYNGTALNNCDVVQMSFLGDIRTWALQVDAFVVCDSRDDLQVVVHTPIAYSPLPGQRSPILRSVQYSSDPIANALTKLFVLAMDDAGSRVQDAFLRSNRTGIAAISLTANSEPCPPIIGFINGAAQPCAVSPPQFNLTNANGIRANYDLLQDDSFGLPNPNLFVLDDVLRPPILNVLQLALAIIRIDLGNPSPNNFLTHPEKLNQTLIPAFPATNQTELMPSMLYVGLQSNASLLQPFSVPGPAILQAVYVCHFRQLKSTGNLIITVFISTMGMFTSGWGIFILLARTIIQRRKDPKFVAD